MLDPFEEDIQKLSQRAKKMAMVFLQLNLLRAMTSYSAFRANPFQQPVAPSTWKMRHDSLESDEEIDKTPCH
jgi:hypothetical protein